MTQRILTNTTESFLTFTAAKLALASVLESNNLRLIPALSGLFILGYVHLLFRMISSFLVFRFQSLYIRCSDQSSSTYIWLHDQCCCYLRSIWIIPFQIVFQWSSCQSSSILTSLESFLCLSRFILVFIPALNVQEKFFFFLSVSLNKKEVTR